MAKQLQGRDKGQGFMEQYHVQLGSLGSAVSSPAGSGAEPQRKSKLMHFSLKI